MIFGELDSAWSLWDRLKAWWSGRTPLVESVAGRFIRLFETHGVHRNQIPRFFGGGLTVADVQSETSLIARLSEEILANACQLFAVRREWLDGSSNQAHPLHYFYKKPEAFAQFLDQLLRANPDGQLEGVVLLAPEVSGKENLLILLREIVGFVGETPIFRYHLLPDWLHSYWKSRAYLTACVAIAWKRTVHLKGRKVSMQDIEPIHEGQMLLGWQGEGFPIFRGGLWYPEDMALEPDAFLDGVDPERNSFGIRSGLELWLELDERGLMDVGLKQGEARPKFIERFERLS